MGNNVRLEDWSCVENSWRGFHRDPWNNEFAPLEVGKCLFGKVYGHPRIEAGHRAHTSIIQTINGNIIRTASETIYELGKPLEAYKSWNG